MTSPKVDCDLYSGFYGTWRMRMKMEERNKENGEQREGGGEEKMRIKTQKLVEWCMSLHMFYILMLPCYSELLSCGAKG